MHAEHGMSDFDSDFEKGEGGDKTKKDDQVEGEGKKKWFNFKSNKKSWNMYLLFSRN